jgi:hypothetical protein
MSSAINLIKEASVYPSASRGQIHIGILLMSCIGDTRLNVNMEEILYRVQTDSLIELFRMVEEKTLRDNIKKYNPTFLEELAKLEEWYNLD